MTRILKEEMARTIDSLETARRDSRLGYEWEQDYIYTPDTHRGEIEIAARHSHGTDPGLS